MGDSINVHVQDQVSLKRSQEVGEEDGPRGAGRGSQSRRQDRSSCNSHNVQAMRNFVTAMLFAFVLSFCPDATGMAGPYDDAELAYKRGDYPATLRLLRPLAEQGDRLFRLSPSVHHAVDAEAIKRVCVYNGNQ